MTTQNSVFVSKASSSWMMFSWRSCRKISISCLRFFISFSDFPCTVGSVVARQYLARCRGATAAPLPPNRPEPLPGPMHIPKLTRLAALGGR